LKENPAQPLSSEELGKIVFEQKLGKQISLDLVFRDENGNAVALRDYFGKKPVILVPGYYRCPMLCSMVLNGLVETLQDMKWKVGQQFVIINFSINPRESSQLAAAKKHSYLRRYGRTGAENSWHFLTGDDPAIHRLADEVGFRYAYDPMSKEYAHPSGFIVLTPKGTVSRYFFGVSHVPAELYQALSDASINRTGSPIQQLFYLCFHYNPIRGKYGPVIMVVLRVAGFGTVIGLSLLVLFMIRTERARKNQSLEIRPALEPAAADLAHSPNVRS
jgi:protein SCO1/2